MAAKWIVSPLPSDVNKIAREYDLNEIIVSILLQRGLEPGEFASFLNPDHTQLSPACLLPDISRAADRIKKAVNRKEKICLYGDYDVDGITSLTVFHEYIKKFTVPVDFYIPHRLKEGYGLNREAVTKIAAQKTTLLICVDCGTNSREEVELARSLGMDVIVLDHHLPQEGENVPYAFVNPKRTDSDYPFTELSAAGVVFKVVQFLSGEDCFDLLDLVALSIVCDVVPLRGENRVLLKEGLKILKKSERPGIRALCEVAKVNQAFLEPFHLGFMLGPRINACGRMSHAQEVFDLFTCADKEYARNIALRLDKYNRLRKSVEKSILKEAEELIVRKYSDSSAFVLSKEDWHPGVLGIVASKLADKYWRPTFVIGVKDELGRGSARSIPGFHLMNALDRCKDFLSSYGGHKKAAGVEIVNDKIQGFREKLNAVSRQELSQRPEPEVHIDCELQLNEISMSLASSVENMKPFGEENREPLFLTRKVFPKTMPKKQNWRMSSFWLSDGLLTYEAVLSRRDGFSDLVCQGEPLDIVYSLAKDYYHNSVRLMIRNIRLS